MWRPFCKWTNRKQWCQWLVDFWLWSTHKRQPDTNNQTYGALIIAKSSLLALAPETAARHPSHSGMFSAFQFGGERWRKLNSNQRMSKNWANFPWSKKRFDNVFDLMFSIFIQKKTDFGEKNNFVRNVIIKLGSHAKFRTMRQKFLEQFFWVCIFCSSCNWQTSNEKI